MTKVSVLWGNFGLSKLSRTHSTKKLRQSFPCGWSIKCLHWSLEIFFGFLFGSNRLWCFPLWCLLLMSLVAQVLSGGLYKYIFIWSFWISTCHRLPSVGCSISSCMARFSCAKDIVPSPLWKNARAGFLVFNHSLRIAIIV